MDKITLQLSSGNKYNSILELKTYNPNLTINENANLLCNDYTNTNGESFNDLCRQVQDIKSVVSSPLIGQDIANKLGELEYKMKEGNMKLIGDIDNIQSEVLDFKDKITTKFSFIDNTLVTLNNEVRSKCNDSLTDTELQVLKDQIHEINKNINIDSDNIQDSIIEVKQKFDKKIESINDAVVELKQETNRYIDESLVAFKNEIFYKIKTELEDDIAKNLQHNLVEKLRHELSQELIHNLSQIFKEQVAADTSSSMEEIERNLKQQLLQYNEENTVKFNKCIVENCTLKNQVESFGEQIKNLSLCYERQKDTLSQTNKEQSDELEELKSMIQIKSNFGSVLNELKDSLSNKEQQVAISNVNKELDELKTSIKALQEENVQLKELSDKMVIVGDTDDSF